ncbi:MAG TPA: glycogen-binding domain-containing protein [Gemmatimonadaceae bacterium]|nr:glycogen-binding domain-containing protein [Gemmatimonadaceae bacterium]
MESTFDIGIVSLRYADSLSVTAATFTPDVRAESERALAQFTGTYSQFGGGGWSTQGTAAGSLFTPTKRNLLGEIAGVAGGSTHADGTRTGQIIGNARLHALGARAGVFSGAGAGATWDGGAWRRLLIGELGGWVQNGTGTALLTLTPVAVDDSVRYVDGQLTLTRKSRNLDFTVLGGARGGGQNPGVDTRTRAWGSVTAAAWFVPRLAVVASGGTYPVDPTQGFPGGRFISLSLRFSATERPSATRYPQPGTGNGAVPEPVPTAPAPGVEGFRVGRANPGAVVLRANAAAATLVEVTGDFTGWTPVKLEATGDGAWTGSFQLKPGHYQMNIRVDGGSWLVPPGLLSLNDEFGGSVGLLIVE